MLLFQSLIFTITLFIIDIFGNRLTGTIREEFTQMKVRLNFFVLYCN
jgi:hypothetical protein